MWFVENQLANVYVTQLGEHYRHTLVRSLRSSRQSMSSESTQQIRNKSSDVNKANSVKAKASASHFKG